MPRTRDIKARVSLSELADVEYEKARPHLDLVSGGHCFIEGFKKGYRRALKDSETKGQAKRPPRA